MKKPSSRGKICSVKTSARAQKEAVGAQSNQPSSLAAKWPAMRPLPVAYR